MAGLLKAWRGQPGPLQEGIAMIVAAPLQRFVTNSLEHHWMPFTANRDFKAAPRLITRSEGMYLWNQNGERLIDGSSGLFNVAAGHGRREIADAVHAQMLLNDYTAPFQVAQPTSFALAGRIAKLLPEDLNQVFFVNSGSEAVDTALKVVMAYHGRAATTGGCGSCRGSGRITG
jgi:beta-alanine--pyruvate transaminase